MTHLPSFPIHSRLLLPETIWLEPEQIEQAKAISALANQAAQEAYQWQSYLNTLALLSFEQWLGERLVESSFQRLSKPIESVCYLEANEFIFCLIAVEQVLDERVPIPQAILEQPTFAAHFYVLHEVSEEQGLVTLRGFCRYDDLINYRNRFPNQVEAGYYQFPLTFLDPEPNHLLFYCRCLQPDAITLPVAQPINQSIPNPTVAPAPILLETLSSGTTKLTRWLQTAVDQNWQMLDQLINPELTLAFNTRISEVGVRRGKLINLGAQLGQQAVALLVSVTPEVEGKFSVLVQLHPTGTDRYLVPNLRLSLRSSAGKTLQEVTARGHDNYIQLKPIKGKPGICFGVEIRLGSETVEESFEL